MSFLSSWAKKGALVCGLSAALLAFPVQSMARCHGVHYGARDLGWSKPFRSDAWPYYEKNRARVRLGNVSDTDKVYVNGCKAGEANKLGEFFLDPGTYNVTVKRDGQNILTRQLHAQNGSVFDLNIGAR